jgi:uncharacterized protein YdhG (YjbR/CyaY superfamily)
MDSLPKFTSVDAYIAAFPSGTRKMLQDLRAAIRKNAPEAVEVISYNMPAFKVYGRILAYFAAHTSHIGFYPGNAAIMENMKEELAGYETSKGTIRFPAGKPIPATLVGKIIRRRVEENRLKSLPKGQR